MFVLFNDTSLQTITHREQRTNVKQINWRPISALFALTNGNWIVWKFSLPNVKAKSITAKIQAITLQPLRKYYFSDWLVLSPIFLSTHHRRDMVASVGTCAFQHLYPGERGFPVWYVPKVIWIAVMFLYNMHCQAKTGKHFSPQNSFQLCFSLWPPRTCCTYVTIILFSVSTTKLWCILVWNEKETSWWFQETFRVPF